MFDRSVSVPMTLSDFYRATLCVRAVLAVARCPSVRPSVTLVDCIQMSEDIVKRFVPLGNPIILVFDPQRRYQTPGGTHSKGRKIHGVGKMCDFRLKSPFTSVAVPMPVRDGFMVR